MHLAFKVGGLVDRLIVNQGKRVHRGQIIATLQLEEIDAQVAKAESVFEKAKRDLERVQTLYADSALTLEQVQNTRTALDIARSDLIIAQYNHRHAIIRAPAAGRVLQHLVEENEMVAPGQPVLSFGNLEKSWTLITGLSDANVVRVQQGDSAQVRLDAYPGQVWPAMISEISGSITPQTGTTPITLVLKQSHPTFKSGFVANVTLYPSQRESFFRIPMTALVDADGSQGAVYTVEDNRARKVDIEIAFLSEDSVAVSTGLEQVKNIVTRGAAYLSDGTPVTVIERERTQP
jgi:RND family efflux transporter MFP subunit